MTENWLKNALSALDEAKAEIEAATETTLFVIITVSQADLLRQRPVSFYGNITPETLGPMLAYCAARVNEKLASPTGQVAEAARVQHIKRGSTYRVIGNAKVPTEAQEIEALHRDLAAARTLIRELRMDCHSLAARLDEQTRDAAMLEDKLADRKPRIRLGHPLYSTDPQPQKQVEDMAFLRGVK